jgi:hypothetical protein
MFCQTDPTAVVNSHNIKSEEEEKCNAVYPATFGWIPAHLNRMLGTEFFPSLRFHRTWQWPRQEMISSVLIVLMKNKMSNLHSAIATVQRSKINRFGAASKITQKIFYTCKLYQISKWNGASFGVGVYLLFGFSQQVQRSREFTVFRSVYFWASFNESSTIDGTTMPRNLLDHRQLSIATS